MIKKDQSKIPMLPGPNTKPSYVCDLDNLSFIKNVFFNYIYLWPRQGSGFWMFPTAIKGDNLYGFRYLNNVWVRDNFAFKELNSFFS